MQSTQRWGGYRVWRSLVAGIAVVCAALRALAVAPEFQGTSFISFANTTPVAIPTGPAVVTSTITVVGAQPILFDLDVQTFITHTFSNDLDITLTSPSGTVVTLTTDNGGSSDDVFNGTVWDDDANPGGQVPYITNDGVVTDHVYASLTVASPLVPEEALGAFIGEDPNGIWTLTISDDLAGDGGELTSWTLDITTLPAAISLPPAVVFDTAPALVIPTGPAVVESTLEVSGLGSYLFDVNLTTGIAHTFPADLDITLTSPSGTVVTLTTDNGGGNDDVFNGTVWDDDANPGGQVPYITNDGVVTDHVYASLTVASPLVPEEALAAFIGENPNGTWTLTISDDLADDGGTLHSWSLEIVAKSPVLKVKKPRKQQQVKRGRKTKVVWKTEGNVGLEVAIELWRNGAFMSTLKTMTFNDGKQKVKIPANAVVGGGYQIRLDSLTTDIEAFSKKFRVVNP